MKISTVTLNNIGAMLQRRSDIEAAQVAFTCAHARWSAADLSGAPKFPRFLKPETPFALHLNLSTNL
jgi:hypothetical protein